MKTKETEVSAGYYNNCLTNGLFVFIMLANCLFMIILISNRQWIE